MAIKRGTGSTPTILSLDVARAMQEVNPNIQLAFDVQPGLQTDVLTCLADEMCLMGQKGAGKTRASIMWLASGNPQVPTEEAQPWDMSYLVWPHYKAVVVRRNSTDLLTYIQNAVELYKPWGAWMTMSPLAIYLPRFDLDPRSPKFMQPIPDTIGAQINTGHLDDANSWMKYIGNDIHRLVFEEIVTVKHTEAIEQLFSCVRSSFPEIRPQIAVSFNPRGPSLGWLQKRYWYKEGSRTETYEPGELQLREMVDTKQKKVITQTRVWFFGQLDQNKYLSTDKYRAQLLSISNTATRKAYLDGEWNAADGDFFGNFRAQGPMEGEPENAKHVIEPCPDRFRPWMRCEYGADWGYSHTASFVRMDVDERTGQVHCTEEFSQSGLSTYEFGVRLGLSAKGRVMAGGVVRIRLGPDAWARESEVESEAVRIKAGILTIVGDGKVLLEGDDIEDVLHAPEGSVILAKATNAREAGWDLLDNWMRWKFELPSTKVFNDYEAQEVLMRHGDAEYKKYMRLWEQTLGTTDKVMPVLQVWNTCPKLINAIVSAPPDENNPNDITKKHWDGADLVDSLRYGAMGVSKAPNAEPRAEKHLREQAELSAKGVPLGALILRSKAAAHQERLEAARGMGVNLRVPKSPRMIH